MCRPFRSPVRSEYLSAEIPGHSYARSPNSEEMKAMESIHDLIEEGKLRAVWWAVCVLFLSYLLSLTSRSIWMNVPIAVFALGAGRVLLKEVDLRWKVRRAPRRGYLAHLQDRQLSPDDPILSTSPSVSINWVRKVDSPVVEHALDEFMGKVLKDFVKDLWYSSITPDEEAPELIKIVVNDVFGEISQRLKDINLVDLLTRDMVKLIGSHLELYRRNQATIGVKVMATLSLDERDEKLRHHLFASKELHPALISSECEYKVLQQLMGGVLAVVLRPREAQCPLVRCLSRELLTCLVMQPIMNLPNPRYINELIESILLKLGDGVELASGKPSNAASHQNDHVAIKLPHSKESQVFREAVGLAKQESGSVSVKRSIHLEPSSIMSNALVAQTETEHFHPPRAADWARGMDAARERRTEVLAPENLENLWAKGRNYKTKLAANDSKSGLKEVKLLTNVSSGTIDSDDHEHEIGVEKASDLSLYVKSSKPQLKRARSFSPPTKKDSSMEPSISETGDAVNRNELEGISKTRGVSDARSTSEMVFGKEGSLHVPSIKCRVIGAYFEKSGSKPFAVYSIAVTSTRNETCFVKRRYSNFERLHRLLKDIPNYSLHLPPKRFLSSSIDDYFVHQRCILLDKYLQELLSISNVAEQHEVRDFLSSSSKNYSSGKSTVMQTLSVNVDDAMDDIVRQFKGVSGGLQGKVGDSPGSSLTTRTSGVSLSEEVQRQNLSYSHREESHSASEDEGLTHEEVALTSRVNGWHSDNELDSKQFPPRVVKHINTAKGMSTTRNQQSETLPETRSGVDFSVPPDILPDPVRVPPEWTPPNVSIPLLNLVDTIFQLKQRGWLRRQVLWISKQVLQLAMEDAIDDWLLRQIHWLRREDVIARGIKWLQDVLWPEGTFFSKVGSGGKNFETEWLHQDSGPNVRLGVAEFSPASFEMQREAARRASDIKKMFLGGAPSTLVSLIGQKQYQRCAKDVYFFLQSTTCVKQLSYSVLELLLISLFPELKDLTEDLHKKAFH